MRERSRQKSSLAQAIPDKPPCNLFRQGYPIDEAEESRVTYLGILPFLQAEPALSNAKTVVIEVGGGSTDCLVVRDGNVLHAHSYRLGSLRLRETLEAYNAPTGKVRVTCPSARVIVETVP